MCGIGLIIAGVAIRGHVFSSETASSRESAQLASEVSESTHPNIEDLCVTLKRRGPDHVGGATLHVGSLKQSLETWSCTNPNSAVHGDTKDVHRSESVTSCKVKKVVNQRMESVVPILNHGASQSELRDINWARLQFVGATLQLRGEHPVPQPLEDSVGNLLVYNGEVFGGLEVTKNENDTAVLMAALCSCCACTCHSSDEVYECKCTDFELHETVPQVLSRLRGPWALIYWQAVSQTVWFGRDAIGRRSLLIHQPSRDDPRLLLTSVAPDVKDDIQSSLKYWEELACGIYSIGYFSMDEDEIRDRLPQDFDSVHVSSVVEGNFWGSSTESLKGWARAHSWQDPWLRTLLAWERQHLIPSKITSLQSSQSKQLSNSQKLSAEDGTVLAPQDGEKICNISFDRNTCETHGRGECALNDANWQEIQEHRTEGHTTPVEQVLAALRQAVKRRTVHIQRQWGRSQLNTFECTGRELNSSLESAAPVAVLFSGGLDSMILAALADQFVEFDYCIDLLNVSFDGDYAPDRITAVEGVAELRAVFPSRRWRLIEIDAKLSDLTDYHAHLQSLICPAHTYMDLNIGTALWLAAGGEGHVYKPPSSDSTTVMKGITDDDLASGCCRQSSERLPRQHPGTSSERDYSASVIGRKQCHARSEARVLLVGSGADEQCGGYGRHRTKFRLGGWKSLEAEMRLDFNRIWKRNLGRDDRCIADQGKEARFPFLDEDVVSTLLGLPLWDVVDLQQPAGIGDKKILRQVAQVLGLKNAASLPKRAIQFGSRIAQESNRKDFGSNRAANQVSAGSQILKKVQ